MTLSTLCAHAAIVSSGEQIVKQFAHLKTGLFIYFLLVNSNSLCILDINSLIRYMMTNSYPIMWVVFSLINILKNKSFVFDVLNFSFFLVLLLSSLRSHCLTQGYEDLSVFSSNIL